MKHVWHLNEQIKLILRQGRAPTDRIVNCISWRTQETPHK